MSTRKTGFKVPPNTLTDKSSSQNHRRIKVLEEQKQRRIHRIESSRNLAIDGFAQLNLGGSDDEQEAAEVLREGIGAYATMVTSDDIPMSFGKQKKKKGKAKFKARANDGPDPGPSAKPKMRKWANKCMYAELLEMSDEEIGSLHDGLPDDLETGWVAVAPVPAGKRCLAITGTQHSTGMIGQTPSTLLHLHTRVLGKSLLPPFPSPLPPSTILDCILDANWEVNGILHVLDVLKWKGTEVADCEVGMRFWWRDTRLSELTQLPPAFFHPESSSAPQTNNIFTFSYPSTLLPIPYHTDTSLNALSNHIIPLARSLRTIKVAIAIPANEGGMDMDNGESLNDLHIHEVDMQIQPDGLLLYVAEALYESGTSPLSSWVPIVSYTHTDTATAPGNSTEGPLDKFSRLVKTRLEKARVTDGDMDIAM